MRRGEIFLPKCHAFGPFFCTCPYVTPHIKFGSDRTVKCTMRELYEHCGVLILKYRILPIKGASPNKGAPHSLGEAKSTINVQNTHRFLNNCPIFNPKTPLES